MKKLTFALAALAVLLFASCASDGVQVSTDTTTADTAPSTETADSRPALTLDERDFNGAAYRISILGSADRIDPEGLTGEAVNDITYERNKNLAEKYNFTVETSPISDFNEHTKYVWIAM